MTDLVMRSILGAKGKNKKEVSGIERRPGAAPSGPDMSHLSRQERETIERAKTVDRLLYETKGLLSEVEAATPLEQISHLEELEALQSMAYDQIASQQRLGEDAEGVEGFSLVSRVEFVDSRGKKTIGYMKPARGEARFDEEGYPMERNEITKKWMRKPGVESLPETDEEKTERVKAGLLIASWKSEVFAESYARGLQQKYGIPESEYAEFKKRTMEEIGGTRLGIEPGSGAVREKVAYDFAKSLGFRIVPPTVLRQEIDEYVEKGVRKERVLGLASVQEGVRSKDTGEPGREISGEAMYALLFQDKSTWAEELGIPPEQLEAVEETLIEAACFHWIVGAVDCHSDNGLLTSDGFRFIDNANIFSKKRGVEIPGDRMAQMHMLRSVPMEILSARPEMVLSEAKRAKLLSYYHRLQDVGPERVVLQQSFLAMEPDPRIAEKEMEQYIERIGVIAATGRPPAEAFSDGQLYPVGFLALKEGHMKDRPALQAKREAWLSSSENIIPARPPVVQKRFARPRPE